MIEQFVIRTPIGPLTVAVQDEQVVATVFDEATFGRVVRSHPFAGQLRAYFAGDVHAIDDIPVAIEGDGFTARARKAMRRVPPGKTISYAELAMEAGSPRAVRAAGTACATNPVGVIVPCHRIVRTGGHIGGYAGGLDRKRWLLAHEQKHA